MPNVALHRATEIVQLQRAEPERIATAPVDDITKKSPLEKPAPYFVCGYGRIRVAKPRVNATNARNALSKSKAVSRLVMEHGELTHSDQRNSRASAVVFGVGVQESFLTPCAVPCFSPPPFLPFVSVGAERRRRLELSSLHINAVDILFA